MTIPWLMNCEHMPNGWCLDCVAKLGAEADGLREALRRGSAGMRLHGFHIEDGRVYFDD